MESSRDVAPRVSKSIIAKTFSRASIIPLVIANTAPLFGVLFFEWGVFQILFLYWLESGIIGFYNVLKLIKLGGIIGVLFVVPFFIFHFGVFMAAHLGFIFALFAQETTYTSFFPPQETIISLLGAVALPAVGLLISHGFSFFFNFIGKREYGHTNVGKQMHAPYTRIFIMHITLIFGVWSVLIFKEPALGLVLLIIIKSIVDIRAHVKEHSLLKIQSSVPKYS